MSINLSQRAVFCVFVFTLLFLLAQAVWWFIFMEKLVQEKISLSEQLGASGEVIISINEEEKARQRMVILEGAVFFLILIGGLALIYRSLIQQQQLRKQQENFMMAVTHELKTPLASMSVYLDSLKSPDIPEQVKQTLIPKIKSDVYRLQRQINNVLEAARTPYLVNRKDYQFFDFSKLVNERSNAMGRFTFDSDYKFSSDVEPNIMFQGDRRNLEKAIDSILENSIIHNKGRVIEISVSLKSIDNFITLEIKDDGQGIPKNELDHIFERFVRVGSELTRSSQGTGLGLYLCREIVKAHHGTVQAVSDGISPGVKFIIKFRQGKN